MKDMVNIQDFLVSPQELGDWEGEEETVADRLNELLHCCYDKLPEQMATERIEQALSGIWDHLRGDMALLDADFDELLDWLDSYVNALLDNDD